MIGYLLDIIGIIASIGVDLGRGRNTPLSVFRPHLSPPVFPGQDNMCPSEG